MSGSSLPTPPDPPESLPAGSRSLRALPAGWLSAFWLPLLGGLLPLVGTLVALLLSQRLGLIPVCNPLIEGCVSISRAARHELPNYIFRGLLLPAAALQALTWWFVAEWLRQHGAREAMRAWLPWVGLTGAAFLVLYGTFLGTEGDGYRWMRRYGVFFYFGCTCIAMLISAGLIRRYAATFDGVRGPAQLMVGTTFALPIMGLLAAFAPLYLHAEEMRNALENILEWWAGVIFTLFFFALAWAWRRARLRLSLQQP